MAFFKNLHLVCFARRSKLTEPFAENQGSPLCELSPTVTSEQQPKKKVLVISGPTGCGKTVLSIELAKKMGGEIISADSMQVYKGMDIGTAKASAQQLQEVPHYLIDTRDISEPFNVVDFFHEARASLNHILQKPKIPIVVGGSGFYIRTLIYGPPKGPSSDPVLRKELEDRMEKLGPENLFEQLKAKDPIYAETITVHDRQKIIRALEIITLTGKKVSDLDWKQSTQDLDFDFRCWFLYRPRETLYPIIESRCDDMLNMGFFDEVRKLLAMGLEDNPSASQSIGYRHAMDFLNSEQRPEDKELFEKAFKQSSRRYAKRQFTWFRNEPIFRWLNLDQHDPETSMDMILKDYYLS